MANAFLLEPLAATVTAVAGTTQLGDPAYLLNDFAGVVWQVACTEGGVSAQVEIDLGGTVSVDTVMVFGVESFPAGGQFQVLLTNAAGQEVLRDSVSPYAGTVAVNGKGVTLWSTATPVLARRVRLHYNAPAAGAAVRASRVVIGRRIQPARNFSFGAALGVKDLGNLEFSRRGTLLRARGALLRTISVAFNGLTRDEVREQTQPLLERLGNTGCVALVTDPAASALRQRECYYGPLVGDLSQVWARASRFEAKVNVVSLF